MAALIDINKVFALRDVNLQTRGWRDIEMTTEQLLGALRDAETGQRGYLLTQDQAYLAPFSKGSSAVNALIAQLEAVTKDRPVQLQQAREIGRLAQQKLEELRETIALNDSGHPADALAVVKTNRGQLLMEQIRAVIEQIRSASTVGIAQNRERANATTRELIASVAVTSLVSIIVLIILTFLLRRDGRHIREAAAQLDLTLRSIGDAVVTTDAKGYVTFVNEVAVRISQKPLSLEPSLFIDHFRLVNEITGQAAPNPVAQVLKDGRVIGLANHTALLRADGKYVSIEDSAAPLRDDDGAIRGVVFVFKDVTERRRAEAELAAATRRLESLVSELRVSEAQLRAADQRKDEFLATLAHELRNPVAPIRHAIELLDSANITPERQSWARAVIARQVKHMSRLLDDLLDAARITRGELNLQIAPVRLNSIVTEALDVVRPLIERKKQDIDVHLAEPNLVLKVDGVRVAQVLSNLLTNAAKYTDEGGRIVLESQWMGSEFTISIKDSGVGLEPAAIAKIFEMFGQVRSTLNRSEGGLGIGLSLSSNLMRMHRGRIEARSGGLGLGSEFVVWLPGDVVEQHDSPAVEIPPPPMPTAQRLILIIDDNVDAATTLGMLLELSGHKVLTAHSGEEGLSAVSQHRPNAVIIDIGLPGMNGYEVAQILRARSGGAALLLIALTGWGQAEDKKLAEQAGFDHHLTKPADPSVVENLIASHRFVPLMTSRMQSVEGTDHG